MSCIIDKSCEQADSSEVTNDTLKTLVEKDVLEEGVVINKDDIKIDLDQFKK